MIEYFSNLFYSSLDIFLEHFRIVLGFSLFFTFASLPFVFVFYFLFCFVRRLVNKRHQNELNKAMHIDESEVVDVEFK